MNAPAGNQRWRARRDSYRVPTETICTADYDVEEIADDVTAKEFVTTHHYSGSYPAARFRFALRRRAELVGVAVFSHPMNNAVLTRVFPGDARDSVELGRFVLADDVPGNGETWFLARCFERLRAAELTGVVSFSDPIPRTDDAGIVVFPGHLGTIYQAFNGAYLGRGKRQVLRLLPDGSVFSARAASKIRNLERGWRGAASVLERFGADAPREDDPRAWLTTWLERITRRVTHPGCHRYAWALAKRARTYVTSRLPYPKRDTLLALVNGGVQC